MAAAAGKIGLSGAALIAVNLVPLAGVLWFGWRAGDVVLLYWVENLIVGVLNLPRILMANADAGDAAGIAAAGAPFVRLRANAPAALFFLLHYGLFCAVHGIALVEIFGAESLTGRQQNDEHGEALLAMLQRVARDTLLFACASALLASHLISLLVNYLWRGEYRRVDAGSMAEQPYRRIMVVQVFAIACGALLQHVDSPAAAVAVFVLVKSAIDFHLHGRERQSLGDARKRMT